MDEVKKSISAENGARIKNRHLSLVSFKARAIPNNEYKKDSGPKRGKEKKIQHGVRGRARRMDELEGESHYSTRERVLLSLLTYAGSLLRCGRARIVQHCAITVGSPPASVKQTDHKESYV